MRGTSILVGKRIEDAERARAKLKPEPDNGRCLGLRQLKSIAKKRGERLFLPGPRLETNEAVLKAFRPKS